MDWQTESQIHSLRVGWRNLPTLCVGWRNLFSGNYDREKKGYSRLSGGLCCCIVSVFGSGKKLAFFLLWQEIFITTGKKSSSRLSGGLCCCVNFWLWRLRPEKKSSSRLSGGLCCCVSFWFWREIGIFFVVAGKFYYDRKKKIQNIQFVLVQLELKLIQIR